MTDRLCISLKDGDRAKIEARVKRDYPRIKNVSQLARLALSEFLENA